MRRYTIILLFLVLLVGGGCVRPMIDYEAPMRSPPPLPQDPVTTVIEPDLHIALNRIGETRTFTIGFEEQQTLSWRMQTSSPWRFGETPRLSPPVLIKREENVTFSQLEVRAERVGQYQISVVVEGDDGTAVWGG